MKTETKDKIVDMIVDIVVIGSLLAFLFAVLQTLWILIRPVKRLFT
jgi:hypothetical protein